MKQVITCNHISKHLSPEKVGELKELYAYYHKLAKCYRWVHKRLKRLRLVLNMTSVGLTIVGGIAGGVTVNPIVIGTLSGGGVLLQSYIAKTRLNEKVHQCKFSHTSYDKILTQLRSFLR